VSQPAGSPDGARRQRASRQRASRTGGWLGYSATMTIDIGRASK
jgi:hypothetical protein